MSPKPRKISSSIVSVRVCPIVVAATAAIWAEMRPMSSDDASLDVTVISAGVAAVVPMDVTFLEKFFGMVMTAWYCPDSSPLLAVSSVTSCQSRFRSTGSSGYMRPPASSRPMGTITSSPSTTILAPSSKLTIAAGILLKLFGRSGSDHSVSAVARMGSSTTATSARISRPVSFITHSPPT